MDPAGPSWAIWLELEVRLDSGEIGARLIGLANGETAFRSLGHKGLLTENG
jgi:hypothetical protein